MSRVHVLFAVVAVALTPGGCGKKPAERSAPAPDAAPVPTEPTVTTDPPPASAVAWADRPLSPVEGEVGGVKFTVRLPDGFTRVEGNPDVARWEVADDPFTQPAFELSLRERFPATAEEGLAMIDPKGPPPSGPVILVNELEGDRYRLMVRNPGSTFVDLYVLHRVGQGALLCKGSRSEPRRLTALEEYGAWFREICDQVTLRQ